MNKQVNKFIFIIKNAENLEELGVGKGDSYFFPSTLFTNFVTSLTVYLPSPSRSPSEPIIFERSKFFVAVVFS